MPDAAHLIPVPAVGPPAVEAAVEEARPGRDLLLALTVYHGKPVGQGAVTFLGAGRGAKHTNEKTLRPWRKAIVDDATRVLGTHSFKKLPKPKIPPGLRVAVAPSEREKPKPCLLCGVMPVEHGLFTDALAVEVTITVAPLKTAPKRRILWPTTRSSQDVDHHARAVLDALSEASVWRDDAQVVDLTIRKRYPRSSHPDVLDAPGAVIRVWRIGGEP